MAAVDMSRSSLPDAAATYRSNRANRNTHRTHDASAKIASACPGATSPPFPSHTPFASLTEPASSQNLQSQPSPTAPAPREFQSGSDNTPSSIRLSTPSTPVVAHENS